MNVGIGMGGLILENISISHQERQNVLIIFFIYDRILEKTFIQN